MNLRVFVGDSQLTEHKINVFCLQQKTVLCIIFAYFSNNKFFVYCFALHIMRVCLFIGNSFPSMSKESLKRVSVIKETPC